MQNVQPLLAITVDGEWRPGIGDPTMLGWFTVVAYLLGACVCFRAAYVARTSSYAPSGAFYYWMLFAIALCVLGVNKQLDLQTWFTIAGKHFAQNTGWYESRRIVQGAFIVCIVVAGASLIALGVRWTRRLPRPYKVALAGGIFLGSFVIIRAASFHHVDQMLGFGIGGVRMNVLLEVGGIACIAFAAGQIARRKPAPLPEIRPFVPQT